MFLYLRFQDGVSNKKNPLSSVADFTGSLLGWLALLGSAQLSVTSALGQPPINPPL